VRVVERVSLPDDVVVPDAVCVSVGVPDAVPVAAGVSEDVALDEADAVGVPGGVPLAVRVPVREPVRDGGERVRSSGRE
jgi:hypothetical protein